jgi:hypothetical protein
MWSHLSLVSLSLAVAAAPAEEAAALVKKLGSPAFAERKAAEEGLLRLGVAALPAVRAGLKSDDPEVRSRCRRLAPQIESEDRARRADAYAADLEGQGRHDLPLRAEYEQLAGTGPAARRLFAEIVRANEPLLRKVAADRARGRDAYREECRAAHDAGKAGAGQLAALLLVSLVLKEDRADWKGPVCFAHLLGNPGLPDAVQDGKLGKPLGRLLLAWADRQAVAEVTSLQFFLYFVSAAEWKEGLPVVRRLIRDRTAAWVNLRMPGVVVLGKVGGKDAAAELEKLWDDDMVLFISPDKHRAKARLGDQALAASIRLAGQSPKDYGVIQMDVALKGPGGAWPIPVHWFASDADRKAALRKWKAKAAK